MIEDLKKKKLFIFGGLGLVGKGLEKECKKFFKKVIIIDIRQNKTKKDYFCIRKIDAKRSFENEINRLIEKYGVPDVLINASYPRSKDWANINFKEISYNQINENLELHLTNYIYINSKFAEMMKEKKIRGSIINLSSIYGIRSQDETIYKKTKVYFNPIYPSIKSAVNMNVKQIASFYGKHGIRCNSICPGGIINTSLAKKTLFIKNYLVKNPIKRFCTTKDIAYLSLFLSSNNSSYITGLNIPLDGGRMTI